MNTPPDTDREDFRLLQEGDERALDRIVGRWQRRLHAFAWRYLQNEADARDVVIDVFVRLFQQRDRLRADTDVGAWLFAALANRCHNQHRWARRHRTTSLDAPAAAGAPASVQDPHPGPDATLDHEEALAALALAIDALPHEWKTAVLLHHYERWSYHDIATALGCSERGIETRLYRARERLRRELASHVREASAEGVTFLPARPG